jgi:hypothetical protein
MKITLETTNKKVEIENKGDDLAIDDIFEALVIPALLALEYQKESIINYFKEYE